MEAASRALDKEPKLASLAEQIRDEHAKAVGSARDAITHAIAAGKLLLVAKATVAHGQWLPWLRANCDLSERQAQRLIRVAQKAPALLEANTSRVSDLSLSAALHLLSKPAEPKSAARRRRVSIVSGGFEKALRELAGHFVDEEIQKEAEGHFEPAPPEPRRPAKEVCVEEISRLLPRINSLSNELGRHLGVLKRVPAVDRPAFWGDELTNILAVLRSFEEVLGAPAIGILRSLDGKK